MSDKIVFDSMCDMMSKQVEQKGSLIDDAEREDKESVMWANHGCTGESSLEVVPLHSGQEWGDTWPVGDEVHYSDGRLTNCFNACPVSSFHALLRATCMYASKPMCCSSQL